MDKEMEAWVSMGLYEHTVECINYEEEGLITLDKYSCFCKHVLGSGSLVHLLVSVHGCSCVILVEISSSKQGIQSLHIC